MVHLIIGAQFYRMTEIHHQDTIGYVLYDRQIVRNKNQRQPHLSL
ncbi:Uncharacterised protein [Salmonella enterica subsp. enterica serovar Bovismorbificans]|uniref:Uncharacterized protein n=1 Tax=Salmonella enterica subsp. enterica serovar Bovismorbificans TaxID=58097 RepID=A0A655BR99_SALET|nr:Uncharacterised protein [Salmonella enterica subsp. enterica serovar Bovismorbificans]